MCILCVASRWSRRIVTMLPWLIIPLIILWALSQLLPPGFRFEVTSPRLACVGVLLISLGWYELAMPRLSMWRARRSALLRERRRIEAQEAAKWRKEATRRCRNCLSAYRDQTPAGGRFMCTFCGHVSKRPVLDVPGAPAGVGITGGMAAGGPLGGIQQTNGAGSVTGGFFGSRSSRGWGGRGWPERGGWVSGGKGWTGNKAWVGTPGGVGWGSGNGSWGATNWPGRSWTGAAYWGGGGANGGGVGVGAGTWTSNGYGGGIFAGESCVAGEAHQGGLFFVLYKVFSFVFFCLRWVWRKLWRGERPGEDGSTNGSRRGGQKKGDEGGVSQGSRVDKARRKAEEKRQARLEREQLEAEERRQREEVARLVEERRRQRDEMLEAEKESEREAAAERERELRRERDAERRRQEKVKEKDKDLTKEKSRDTDSEDSKKKKEKDHPDKKSDGEKRVEVEKKSFSVPNGEVKKPSKSSRGVGIDLGSKGNDIPVKAGSAVCGKSGSSRYFGAGKGAGAASLKSGLAHQNNTSFWGKGLTRGLNSGSKAAKAASLSNSNSHAGSGASAVASEKLSDSSYSAWNRMPWTKVWGKNSQSTTEGNIAPHTGNSNLSARENVVNQTGGKPSLNSSNGNCVSDLSQATGETKQQTPVTSQSWQRLFSNNIVVSSPPNTENHLDPKQSMEHANPSVDTLSAPSDSHTTLIFGHGLQGSVITQLSSVVTPVGPPVHSSAPSTVPISPSLVTSNVSGSAFTSAHGALPLKPSVSPPVLAPTPIGKTSQLLPVHSPVSGPLHMPAPIQVPVPITSQSQTNVPQDQLPQILEPWGQPPLSLDDPSEVQSGGDKWQMWDTPQLDQRQMPSLSEPLPWNYLGSSFRNSQKDSLRTLNSSLEPENQLPVSLFSPQQHVGVGCSSGEFLTPLPVGNSQSLWSDHSAFESAMRIWADSDSHQRVPPEFVDCITQEVMLDPVITADGHSYERAAIERWLQTHDTSPITGEVLPPPPGGYGSGVDKTLRPNHILRGQIIEYRENMARLARGPTQETTRDNNWSTVGGLGLGSSAWSTIPNAERPHIGGFYTTPGAQSVWSFNGPQNSMLPPL